MRNLIFFKKNKDKARLEPKNTMIVSTERSGTNYLLEVYANCMPDTLAFREIFRSRGDSFVALKKLTGLDSAAVLELVEKDPLRLWQRVETDAARNQQQVIAKIFYNHAPDHTDLWDYLRQNTRIIHLFRKRPFDAFVSRRVANQTGKWRLEKQAGTRPMPDPFEVSRGVVEEYVDWHAQKVSETRTFFEGSDFHEIFYEDIGRSAQHAADAVCRAVGVAAPTGPVTTKLIKQKNYTNAEIVLNYDELRFLDRDMY